MTQRVLMIAGLLMALHGCGGGTTHATTTAAAASAIHEWSVAEVKSGSDAQTLHVFDANRQETFNEGHVPGAVWVGHELSASALPADHAAAVAFYCFNEQCGASRQVAEQAVALGYTNVGVMEAGIEGWRAAGNPVEAAVAPVAPVAAH